MYDLHYLVLLANGWYFFNKKCLLMGSLALKEFKKSMIATWKWLSGEAWVNNSNSTVVIIGYSDANIINSQCHILIIYNNMVAICSKPYKYLPNVLLLIHICQQKARLLTIMWITNSILTNIPRYAIALGQCVECSIESRAVTYRMLQRA